MKWPGALFLLVLSFLAPAASGASGTAATIVPPEGRISDDEARLSLARILSYNNATLKESLAEYTILMRRLPGNTGVAAETADVMIRLGMLSEARLVLNGLYEQNPRDIAIITSLADVECGLGHARTCRDLYLKALDYGGHRPDLTLRFADRMNLWGDFYRAESIYRDLLRESPRNPEIVLKLARALASSERYEEASEIYEAFMGEGHRTAPFLTGLAETKLWQKDSAAAERYAREAVAIDPASTGAYLTMARSFIQRGDYAGARSVYDEAIAACGPSADLFVNIGITYMKEGNVPQASGYFKKAIETDERNIPARFYSRWPDAALSERFVESLLEDSGLSAADLSQWAALYSSQGHYGQAQKFLDTALKKDPAYFPASVARAAVLAAARQYDESIATYKALSREFPEDSKIMTGEARTLAWSRQYDESTQLYRRIIALNPRDPVPRRELARTLMWAKRPSDAATVYDEAIQYQARTKHPDEERLKEPPARDKIARSLTLERDAKMLAHDKRFARSLSVYETLIKENPGNEEALFDEAQVTCALGLCDTEGKIYDKLLTIDPMHALARESREWQRSRSNPSVRFDYSYWNEEGRGDLARITRNRFDTTFDIPVNCQYHVFLKGHRWLEHPDFDHNTYGATGFSLGFGGTVNSFLTAEASWTHKQYDSSSLGNKDTGYGTIWLNAHDRLKIGAGYSRTDELYNYFGIDQGIQADRYWIGFRSDVTRRFELYGRGEYINYTDSNSGAFFGLTAGYALTDHPRIFKISAAGEYRDTRHDNEYVYRDGNLMNIIHPYWAPRDYFAGSIIFEWRHDLAKIFICGAGQHYYDIKASFGTDTENNPYAKLEAEWNIEFTKNWLVGLRGMVHTSPEWNATGAWALLRYRF